MFNEKVNKLVKLAEEGILTEEEMLEAVRIISKDVEDFTSPPLNKGLSYKLVYEYGTIGYEVSLGSCEDCYYVNIYNTYRSLPVIGIADMGFEDCGSCLHEICFPNSLLYIGNGAFQGCINLEDASLKYTKLLKIGEEAFLGCDSLKSIDWPETLMHIGERAYSCCESLMRVGECNYFKSPTDVIAAENLKILPFGLFDRCYNLRSIALNYSKIEIIDDNAFSRCFNVEKVYLPRSLKELGRCAFSECENLREIVYDGEYEKWLKINKAEDWNRDTPSFTLKCSDCEVTIEEGESYLYTEQWLKDRLRCNPHEIIKEQIIKEYLDHN